MKKSLLATGAIILIVAFFVYGKNLQGSIRFNGDKISPPSTAIITDELNKRLTSSGNNKLSIHVILKEQADTRGIKGNYKEIRKRKEAVVNKRESRTDEKAFRNLVARLEQEKHITEVQKFWLVNSYSLLADNYAIRELKKNADVQLIDLTPEVVLDASEPGTTTDSNYNFEPIEVYEAWEMGYRGEGITVGIIDSLIFEEHPALTGKIITLPNNKKAYFNSSTKELVDPQSIEPDAHGTHVAGIIVGGKATGVPDDNFPKFNAAYKNKDIGVAPEASYVYSSQSDAVAAFQWIADPDSNPNTPDFPIAVNCSWHFKFANTSLYPWIDALDDLGINLVMAAGNNNTPKSIAKSWNYPSLVLVANYDTYKKSVDLENSSQGPITYGDEEYIKPDITAPGTKIFSSVPAGSYIGGSPDIDLPLIYKNASGTSMATPHVTSAIVLIQQAYFSKNNFYLSPNKIRNILQLTANSLGQNEKSNISGAGLIKIASAIELALNHGTLKGTTKNLVNEPVPFARITMTVNGVLHEFTSDHNGEYELALPAGNYALDFHKNSAASVHFETEIANGATVQKDILLNTDADNSLSTDSIPEKVEISGMNIILTNSPEPKIVLYAKVKNSKGAELQWPPTWKIIKGDGEIFANGNIAHLSTKNGYEGTLIVEMSVVEMPDIKTAHTVVAIKELPTKVTISPEITTLSKSYQQFKASTFYTNGDQVDYPFIEWELEGVGSINSKGFYKVGNVTGSAKVIAKLAHAKGVKDSVEFTVTETSKSTILKEKDLYGSPVKEELINPKEILKQPGKKP